MQRSLQREVGNWVVGERFFGREAELERFIGLLDEGASISLIAPRRIGKTSLMREAARRIDERHICLHVDLEASRTPADMFAELYRVGCAAASLTARFRDWLQRFVQNVADLKTSELTLKVHELFSASWQDRADQLLAALVERNERRVVLFFDEVPIFVRRLLTDSDGHPHAAGTVAAEVFLSWLRRAVQRHQGHLSLVFTGSIGLEPMLRRAGISATVNHLTPFELPPWDEETVLECLRALGRHYKLRFEDDAERHVLAALGVGIPHHVQLFFDLLLQDRQRTRPELVRPSDVDRVREQLLSSRGRAFLSHYEERLRLAMDPALHRLAHALLTEAAVCKQLTHTAAQLLLAHHDCGEYHDPLSAVFDVLEHDGYLVATATGHRFESHLLRDWWAARFGRNHVEVTRR